MLLSNLILFFSSLALFMLLIYIVQILESELRPDNYKRSLLNQQIAKRGSR